MKGVSQDERNNRFIAYMTINGVRNYIGSFDNYDDALEARQAYEKEHKHKRVYKKSLTPCKRESDPSKKITFTCEADGCNNEKTLYRKVYNQAKNHYCSQKCCRIDAKGKTRSGYVKDTRTKKEIISDDIRNYFKENYNENSKDNS